MILYCLNPLAGNSQDVPTTEAAFLTLPCIDHVGLPY